MTDTTTTATEELLQEPTLDDLIADATDRFIDDLEDVVAKWAKDHGERFGGLPTIPRAQLYEHVSRMVSAAIYVPAKRAPLEPTPPPGLAR